MNKLFLLTSIYLGISQAVFASNVRIDDPGTFGPSAQAVFPNATAKDLCLGMTHATYSQDNDPSLYCNDLTGQAKSICLGLTLSNGGVGVTYVGIDRMCDRLSGQEQTLCLSVRFGLRVTFNNSSYYDECPKLSGLAGVVCEANYQASFMSPGAYDCMEISDPAARMLCLGLANSVYKIDYSVPTECDSLSGNAREVCNGVSQGYNNSCQSLSGSAQTLCLALSGAYQTGGVFWGAAAVPVTGGCNGL